MRFWFLSQLFDEHDDAQGGGGAPAATAQLDDEDFDEAPAADKKPPEKSDVEKRLEALERDNQSLRSRLTETEEDARYWAKRAQSRGSERDPDPEPDDDEEDDEEARGKDEKPEKVLDDLGAEGAEALRKRGFVTRADLKKAVKEATNTARGEIDAARQDAEMGARIAQEFPDIAADSRRIDNGEKPQSPLFIRAAELYRRSVQEDPGLKGAKSLLLICARQAAAELKAEGKGKPARGSEEREEPRDRSDGRQRQRRERIERQMPERGEHDEGGDREESFTPEQLEVMKRMKIKPEQYERGREQMKKAGGVGRRRGR